MLSYAKLPTTILLITWYMTGIVKYQVTWYLTFGEKKLIKTIGNTVYFHGKNKIFTLYIHKNQFCVENKYLKMFRSKYMVLFPQHWDCVMFLSCINLPG